MRSDSGSNPGGALRASRLITPSEWYQLLNGKTFFWVAEKDLKKFLNAKLYRVRPHDVLTVDTREMLRRHRDRITLAPFNTGSTLGRRRSRGPESFQRIEDYSLDDPHSHVVELAVAHHVPDIADLTLAVEAAKRVRSTGSSANVTWGVFAGAWAETALPHAGPWRRRASRVSGIPVRSANAWRSREQRLLRNAQPLLPLGGLVPVRAVGAVPRQQNQRRGQCSEPRRDAGGGQGRPHRPLRAPQRRRPARTSDAPRGSVLASRGRTTRRPAGIRFERARWRRIGHVSTTSVLAAGGVWPVRTGDQMDGRRSVWREAA